MGCIVTKDNAEPGDVTGSKDLRPPAARSDQSSDVGSATDAEPRAKQSLDATSTSTGGGEAASLPLTRPSAPLSAPPPGDGRNLVLIVWDIENVRLPLNTAAGLSPRHVVRYLKQHFIYGPGRTEYRSVAALTERSLARIRRDHPHFVEQVVPDLTLLLASAVHAKRNADVVLKKELHQFTTEHAHTARACPGQLSIVLISGDEDFLEPVQGALAAGFAVQLLTHDTASGALLAQGYVGRPGLWSAFLRGASGVRDVVLPYGDEQMHSLLRPRSLVLAGFGQRRGSEAARAHTLRLLSSLAARHGPAAAAAAAGASGAAGVVGGAQGGGGAGQAGHGAGGLEAAADAELSLVEPSFGEFSGSCCVVVTPRRAGTDTAALAAGLRLQCAGGGGGGGSSAGGAGGGAGGSPGPPQGAYEPRLVVFEARRLLRLTLQSDETWAPADPDSAPGGQGNLPDADEAAAAHDDADAEPAEPAPFNAVAGRGLHDRLADACERVNALLRGYRLPAGALPAAAAAAHARPGQGPGQHGPQLSVLCRFFRAPGPGELACTMILGAPVAAEAADVLAALTHLRAAGPELLRAHGVGLAAECMFTAAAGGATGEGDAEGQEDAAEAVIAGGVPSAVVAGGALELAPDLAPRGRLPALPFRPQSIGSAQAAGGGVPHDHPQQQQQQQQPAAAAAAPGGGDTTGAGASHAGVPGHGADAAASGSGSEDENGEGGGKKKRKRKKKKKKKKNKRNSVVPL